VAVLALVSTIFVMVTAARADDDYDRYVDGEKTWMQKAVLVRTGIELRKKLPPSFETKQQLSSGGIEIEAKPGEGDGKSDQLSVFLYYSSNAGGDWKRVELARRLEKPSRYHADLEAVPQVGSVRVSDNLGRASVEMSCRQESWPPGGAFLDRCCALYSGSRLEECVSEAAPVGCMFPLASEELPVDDLPARAGDDLDMTIAYAGFDDEYLYVAIAVQKDISPGSLTPVSFHQYGFVVLDPRKIVPASEDYLPHDGLLVRYVPFGEGSPDFVPACSIVKRVEDEFVPDTGPVDCIVDSPLVYIRLNRQKAGIGGAKYLIITAHTGIISGLTLDNFSFINMTRPTGLYLTGAPEQEE